MHMYMVGTKEWRLYSKRKLSIDTKKIIKLN